MGIPKGIMPFGGEYERRRLSKKNKKYVFQKESLPYSGKYSRRTDRSCLGSSGFVI